MKSTLHSTPVKEILESLYADAAQTGPRGPRLTPAQSDAPIDELTRLKGMGHAYMAVPREFGRLLYSLARGARARNVVEFGTSFGVSTIYLAAAVRDNGGGTVTTTEFLPEKAERARQNLAQAGLLDCVEFLVGDARETLASPPRGIDMLFLDGAKVLYLDVLKLVEPQLRSGAIVASDNTDHEGLENFLAYIRNPDRGYTSAGIMTDPAQRTTGREISVRH
ncbi:MAG: O-methyltransferase [Verrucomicrobia bacterium]|nr:O-methyltransferase [Verrucomicrobiota bacterium]